MQNAILPIDWLNHYISKLCEIDEVLDSGKSTLCEIKVTLTDEFISKTTNIVANELQNLINTTENMKEDISETINILRNVITELV